MVKKLLIVVLFGLLITATARAADLTGYLTADNHYDLYLSTNVDSLGSSLFSSTDQSMTWNRPYDWETAESLGITLNPQDTNYLQVVAWDQGVIAGLLGNLQLNNSGFRFDNGLSTLDTNALSGWTARTIDGYDINTHSGGTIGSSLLTIYAEGANGSGIWGSTIGNPVPNINANTQWIWTSENGQGDVGSDANPMLRLFTVQINPVAPPVPEPISTSLFLLGAGAFGVKAFRRKKKLG